MKFYRIERWLFLHKFNLLARLVNRFIYLQFNCVIPYSTEIEDEVEIVHGVGIVLHQNSKIGRGTRIYQNVTVGNGNGPKIGENCILGTGAVILGNIKIGNNVKIGANAVVLNDLPDNCTAVGIPATIVKKRG